MLSKRSKEIMEILSIKKNISTEVLRKNLFCSSSTLRRELLILEQKGLVARYHGGVGLVEANNREFSHYFREKENLHEKEYIANMAVDFIGEGYSIFLDSSSTVNELCKHLEQYSNLIVVTNGLQTALTLGSMDQIRVYLAGGEIKTHSTSVIGEMAGDFLEQFYADIVFLSCRGFDANGIYEASLNQALIKQHMINNAKKIILCADNSKYNSPHFFQLTTFSKIDVLLTNQKPSDDFLKEMETVNCEVLY